MKVDSKVDSIVQGILDYLTAKKSLDLLPQILEQLSRQGLNRVDPNLALVKAPIKLDANQVSELRKKLTRIFGRPIVVKTRIDISIIAGLVIEVGGQVIDASLNKQLDELKEEMLYD